MLEIKTRRLTLRDFRREDLEAYCALRTHTQFQRFYSEEDAAPERSAQLLEMFIGYALERPRRRFQLAITLRTGALIGSCGVRVTSAEEGQASFGCEVGQEFWGEGYAHEASRAVIDYGFRELGLHRVYAETLAGNERALRLARKLGMREEGVLRENRRFKDVWWSTVVLSVLESEWETARPGE